MSFRSAGPPAVLEAFVRAAAPLMDRAAPVSEVVRAAAADDDEVRAVHDKHDLLQRAGYRRVVELAAARGALGHGLPIDTATDVLLTRAVTASGWNSYQGVDWLRTTVPAAILAL